MMQKFGCLQGCMLVRFGLPVALISCLILMQGEMFAQGSRDDYIRASKLREQAEGLLSKGQVEG